MLKHFKIYITDIIGEKRIDLAYPIRGTKVAFVSMFSDNIQYCLKGPTNILLKTGKEKELSKRVYMDKELNALIGLEKLEVVPRAYAFKVTP